MGTYQFDSIAEFARASEKTYTPYGASKADVWWNDGQVHSKTFQMALVGDDSLVADAEAMLEKINRDVECPHNEWQRGVYGAYPIVPEFLAGSPDPMRRLVTVPNESSPMRIFVDLNCSAGFSAKDLLKHGTAILALMMRLEMVRPIELVLVCALPRRNTKILVKVNSKPLSLSEACFGLCRVAFCRNLMFGYATAKDGGFSDRIIDTERELRRYLGDLVSPGDLVVRGPHIADPIMTDPIKWINEMLDVYLGEKEETRFVEREEEEE